MTIFHTDPHMQHPCTCILKLTLSPDREAVQFNYEAGNACTCCLQPACHVTLSSQLLKLKFCLALLDNTASNDENMYDDDLDAGGRTHCFPTLLLLLSISHESRAFSLGKATQKCHLVSLAEQWFFAVPTLMLFFMVEEFSPVLWERDANIANCTKINILGNLSKALHWQIHQAAE